MLNGTAETDAVGADSGSWEREEEDRSLASPPGSPKSPSRYSLASTPGSPTSIGSRNFLRRLAPATTVASKYAAQEELVRLPRGEALHRQLEHLFDAMDHWDKGQAPAPAPFMSVRADLQGRLSWPTAFCWPGTTIGRWPNGRRVRWATNRWHLAGNQRQLEGTRRRRHMLPGDDAIHQPSASHEGLLCRGKFFFWLSRTSCPAPRKGATAARLAWRRGV